MGIKEFANLQIVHLLIGSSPLYTLYMVSLINEDIDGDVWPIISVKTTHNITNDNDVEYVSYLQMSKQQPY